MHLGCALPKVVDAVVPSHLLGSQVQPVHVAIVIEKLLENFMQLRGGGRYRDEGSRCWCEWHK